MLNTEDFGMGGEHLSAGSSRFEQVRVRFVEVRCRAMVSH